MKINGADINAAIKEPMPRTVRQAEDAGYDKASIKQMARSGRIECETCANRKYKDGSDEMVSFKSPAHISPQSAASAVRSHEQEHVSNAYKKAANNNGKVMQASVRIKTSICPECGRSYVSGGETTTQIKYNEENPYGKSFKGADAAGVIGSNFDLKNA
ncbi:MAG: hypothetical protein OSJ45_13720 [Lachnospiraceae bacterium]|nr:hypothetical protein [Lachnospiraceae bacterium]